jgi:hypothetical protein
MDNAAKLTLYGLDTSENSETQHLKKKKTELSMDNSTSRYSNHATYLTNSIKLLRQAN